MDLLRKIKAGGIALQDKVGEPTKIPFIDLHLSPSFGSFCQIRIDNASGDYTGKAKAGDALTVDISMEGGFIRQFTGIVTSVFEAAVIRIDAGGNSEKLKAKKLKKGFNKIQASEILKFILQGTGVEYEAGKLPTARRHSYSIAGGTPAEELLRMNQNFALQFVPYFNKAGKLIFKTFKENVLKTKIEYFGENLRRFDDGTFEAPLNTGLDIFDQIKILDVEHVVTYSRILIDDHNSRVIFAAEKA